MQAINRSLLAIALCALFAAPAFAGDNPPAKAKKPAATETAKASDAVSARATQRESGRMAESPVKAGTTLGADSAATTNPGKGNWWADADIDGDGKLSAAEARAQAGLDARFSSVDADADGYVSSDEYRKYYTSEASQGEQHAAAHSAVVTRDVWTRLDDNADGKLSIGEVKSDTSISGAFSGMDANGDGFVTQAEYSAYAKAHMH
jgi:hypothetical protein